MCLALALAGACSGPETPAGPSGPGLPPQVPQWHGEQLGGSFDVLDAIGGPLDWYGTSLDLAADGVPLVAYSAHGAYSPVLARWGGAAWAPLGDPPDVRPAGVDAVARTSEGEPVLAWVEWEAIDSSKGDLRAHRWSGGAWLPMGGSINGTPEYGLDGLRAASGPAGPVLAWTEGSASSSLRVVRWDGSGWVELPARSGEYLGFPCIALMPSGDPVVSVLTGFGAGHILTRWDPGTSAWVALPALTLPANVAFVDVAVDGDGATYAAVTGGEAAGYGLFDGVYRLAPGELGWTPLGNPPRYTEAISSLAIAGLPGGGVAAAWTWASPELARWKDGAWETVGTWTASAGYQEYRPLIRAATDDDLYVAFTASLAWPETMKVVRYRKY